MHGKAFDFNIFAFWWFPVLFGADCLANCYKFDNGVFSLSFSGDKTFAEAMNASESPKRPETMSVGALTHIRFE
jgi:hypothetical protein